jgi:DNA modification methylase
MTVQIKRGDCRAVMRKLTPGSIDAVVTDPPYGIDFQSAWRTEKTARLPKIANDARPFVWWLPEAFDVLKDGGALICFCRWDTQEAFRLAIEWAGFTIRSQVIWDREWHGMGDLKASFAPQHDVIWFATKGRFQFPGKRPRSIIRSQRIGGEALTHPNEKPVDLMRELVRAVTPPGGTVLDPFAGSGATLKAAKLEGFKAIGIEIDDRYAASTAERLAA